MVKVDELGDQLRRLSEGFSLPLGGGNVGGSLVCPKGTGQLVNFVIRSGEELCDIKLYPYQYESVFRLIESILRADGETLTMMFSRQCIVGGSRVSTLEGFKLIEDCKAGDKVLSLEPSVYVNCEFKCGGYVREDEVLEGWYVGEELVWEVEFYNRGAVVCTSKHRFFTMERGWDWLSGGL